MKKITIFSELRNEFSGLISQWYDRFSRILLKYPKAIFFSMAATLAGSVLLCFTILRVEEKKFPSQSKAILKVGNGVAEIGVTMKGLKRTLELQSSLKVLLAKDSLDAQDSLLMVAMIKELEKISGRKN